MSATPGPWTVGARREILGQAFDQSAKYICDKVRGGSPEAADANARLIAAAPDLLAALKSLADIGERVTADKIQVARAAIAKATATS